MRDEKGRFTKAFQVGDRVEFTNESIWLRKYGFRSGVVARIDDSDIHYFITLDTPTTEYRQVWSAEEGITLESKPVCRFVAGDVVEVRGERWVVDIAESTRCFCMRSKDPQIAWWSNDEIRKVETAKEPVKNEVKVGSVVKLRSGSAEMTVHSEDEKGMECLYFDEKMLIRRVFAKASLEFIR